LSAEGTGVVGQWVGERGEGAAAEEETVTCIGACIAPDGPAGVGSREAPCCSRESRWALRARKPPLTSH
jgi:hypothetical protein